MPPEVDELCFQAEHVINIFVRSAPLAGLLYQIVLERGETEVAFRTWSRKPNSQLTVINVTRLGMGGKHANCDLGH